MNAFKKEESNYNSDDESIGSIYSISNDFMYPPEGGGNLGNEVDPKSKSKPKISDNWTDLSKTHNSADSMSERRTTEQHRDGPLTVQSTHASRSIADTSLPDTPTQLIAMYAERGSGGGGGGGGEGGSSSSPSQGKEMPQQEEEFEIPLNPEEIPGAVVVIVSDTKPGDRIGIGALLRNTVLGAATQLAMLICKDCHIVEHPIRSIFGPIVLNTTFENISLALVVTNTIILSMV